MAITGDITKNNFRDLLLQQVSFTIAPDLVLGTEPN